MTEGFDYDKYLREYKERAKPSWLKGVEPKESDKVTITYDYPPGRRDRFMSHKQVVGPYKEALGHAAWLIETATCTQQYEHMLPVAHDLTRHPDGETVSVHIRRSNYAGD